jgi:MFS family permease
VICGLGLFEECWRGLYFFGCSTAIFAFFLRLKMPAHPSSSQPKEESSLKFILKSCWESRQALITIAVASGFSYSCYMIALVTLNGFIPLVTSITKDEMMHLNTVLLCFDFLLLPIFGWMAKRFSREKMMIASGALSAIAGIPLFWFLEGASLGLVVIIRFILVVLGVWFSAPFHAWAQKLVPPSRRYTILSFAYALGSQILGGPSAAVSLWVYQYTQSAASVGAYWMLLGLLTTILIARHKYSSENLKKPLPS